MLDRVLDTPLLVSYSAVMISFACKKVDQEPRNESGNWKINLSSF